MTLQLYNADCLEQMKSIPDNSIDLIICDLPYGCLASINTGKIMRADHPDRPNPRKEGTIAGCAWDIKLDLDLFWKQIRRIRKNDHTPCIHFCSTKFGYELIKSNEKEFRFDLVWNKIRGVGFLTANKKPMAAHEMIYFFSKKGCIYNRIDTNSKCVTSVIEHPNVAKNNVKQHSTAKPTDLYKWLIERYSNEGDTVLDPTFGSCNSGKVCQELKRNYIGIEMNKEFFDKAQTTLQQPTASA